MSDPVRLATVEDYDLFMNLAAAYLVELRELGSEVKPTVRSLAFYRHIFEVATGTHDYNVSSVVALVEDFGFSVAADFGPPMLETEFGRTAYGHGTYVKPEHRHKGFGKLLRDCVRCRLKEMGFDTVVGGVHINNDLGAKSLAHTNFTWYQLVGYERL